MGTFESGDRAAGERDLGGIAAARRRHRVERDARRSRRRRSAAAAGAAAGTRRPGRCATRPSAAAWFVTWNTSASAASRGSTAAELVDDRPERRARRPRRARAVMRAVASKRSVMTPSTPQPARRPRLVRGRHRPGHDELRARAEVGDGRRVEQLPVDRDAREPPPGEAPPQRAQLAAAAHRVHEPDARHVAERLEQRPVARADGDARRPRAGERFSDPARQPGVAPLQVEHQLGAGGGRGEQRVELAGAAPSRARAASGPTAAARGPIVLRWRTSTRPRRRWRSASTSRGASASARRRMPRSLPARWATTNGVDIVDQV